MAGMGKRMRPHTLTVPKPLIPIAGKPIVQRLVEDIARVIGGKIDEIAFIVGRFGCDVEKTLISIAENIGAKGHICYQDKALGTAHAVYCAKDYLEGNVIVAFADTLFDADFSFDRENDATIWVQRVPNPELYGVVKLDDNKVITEFIEKPQKPVSDLAIIGIYYFREGEVLRDEIQQLIDNKVVVNGEFQLTDALENMKNNDVKFRAGVVREWLDCGNKKATVYTNQRILELCTDRKNRNSDIKFENSIIIEPCYIGDNVVIKNSVVGPHVSLGANSKVKNSVVKNSIIQTNSKITDAVIADSMIGNYTQIEGKPKNFNLGDYSQI